MVSLHGSVCARMLVFVHALVCVCISGRATKRQSGGKGGIDNMMFTLDVLLWERASIQPCCDTHHTSNLVAFIITLYSQRPHLVCYYQRSLLFPSMYVWNPFETNMSHVDNGTILVNPIVYVLLRMCNPERIPISDFEGFNRASGRKNIYFQLVSLLN